MIKFAHTEVMGFPEAIRGMRNPKNSWEKSDSGICKGGDDGIGCKNCAHQECDHTYDNSYQIGKEDHKLMMKLVNGGSVHAKFRRMITVYIDITAPLYWWKEFDTYKVGTVANSCSTMHKLADKEFTLEDFSCEHLLDTGSVVIADEKFDIDGNGATFTSREFMELTCVMLNFYRKKYIETKDKKYWWQIIQLLPSSYNQKRTIMLNYEVLAGIYPMRKDHKLDEWEEFRDWIESLPYSEIITGEPDILRKEFNISQTRRIYN